MRGAGAAVGDPPWELFATVGVAALVVCVIGRLQLEADQQIEAALCGLQRWFAQNRLRKTVVGCLYRVPPVLASSADTSL
jgi:hypothetical protein